MTQDRAARRRARRTGQAARVAGLRRRPRPALLASTALQATTVLLLAFPVAAQPAPGARPIGGAVVGGAASISQSTAQTTVAQSSQRAAIDWRSYDIGSGHTVQYLQPSASAIVLNRVTGPDPSQIAGRIQANGQVVITNPSGVVFYQGSQVNAQTLIVSAAGISTQNFMAGKMLFDRPGHADARISNAGEISVAGTGLAALVAPQVANSGVIRAKMGHVVLAGAEAHTVDLYGDGLMSVDVTKEVRHTPGGGTALVTNTGTIMADGGTIVLTAKAADGIVQNLVSAGGRLQADTVGGHAGSIVVSAVGGTISIEGAIHADGRAPGAGGGAVTLVASDTVAVKAGARISASGQGGGGTVAVGTTLARARAQGGGVPDGAARVVDVAAGARISADGRGTGSGGNVAILATERTAMAGGLSAKGGARGGNGGSVEVSGRSNYSLTGTISTAAPHGTPGNILLDPDSVTIVHGAAGSASDDGSTGTGTVPAGQGTGSSYTISDGTISGFAGNVTIQATGNVTVTAGVTINLTGGLAQPTPVLQNLVLQAGNNLTVSATAALPTSITASGNVVLTASAASAGISGVTTNGVLSVGGAVTSTNGSVFLASNGTAAGASVFVNANVSAASAGGVVSISGNTAGVGPGVLVTAGQRIDLATTNGAALTIGNTTVIDPTATLAAPRVRIGQASLSDGVTTPADGAATTAITFASPFSTAGTLELRTTGSVIQASMAPVGAGQLVGSASGSITLNNPGNAIGALGTAATGLTSGTGNSAITTTGALDIAGAVDVGSANKLTLNAATITESTGTINAGFVDTTSTAGPTTLDKANTFTSIAAASATGHATFDVTGALNLAGPVNVGANTLSLSSVLGLTQSVAGTITAGTLTGTVGDANAAVTTGRDAILNGIGNGIGNLSDFTVKQGNLALADTQPLTQLAGRTVTARNVTLSTTDLVINGNVGACAIDPVTAGLVTLNATGHVTIAGVVGGENKTVVNGATGTTVTAGFLEAGNPASTTATLQINNGLTLTGGSVAANLVSIGGNVMQSGGTLVLTGGLGGTYSFTGGSVYSPAALSLVSTGFAAGSVISAPSVSVTEPSATPVFSTGADVFAPGNISFTLQGGFSQTGGQIVSGGSLAIGGGGGVPASGTITQSGGTLASQAGVTLYSVGSGAVTLGGTLVGPTIQVIEPFAAVSFGPTALAGGFTQTAPAAAVTLHCPSCDGLSPGIGVTAGGLIAGPVAAAVRVDSGTLNLTSNFTAGTLELHSTGSTTQTAPFTAATLLGTAGYAVTIQPFALPTWNTPAGAGGAGLIAPNSIARLGPYYAGGILSVASNTAMTVVDKVVAGANQTVTLQAPTLTVDGLGASGFVALGTVTNGAFSTALRPANAGIFALPTMAATATAYGTVGLATDHLTLSGAAPVVNAAGGVVAIAPFTAGAAVSVDGAASAGTWVVAPQLALVNTLGTASSIGFGGPQTLRLGSLDGTLPGAPSSLTVNAPMTLVNVAGTLGLYSSGAINETAPGGLTIGRPAVGAAPRIVGTLTGQAAGAVTLTGGNGALTLANADTIVPTNHFDVLAGFSANGLSVADGAVAGAGLGGLAVTGTIAPGAGDLGLLSVGAVLGGVRQGGTIALGSATAAATVSAANQTVTLAARDGVSTAAAITQTAASTLAAGTLAARASTADTAATAYDVVLGNASNAVAALGNVSVGTTLPSGLLSAQGGFTVRSGGPSLGVTGLVAAKTITITANAMTVSGGIGACAVGGIGGTVTLNNTGLLAIGGTVGAQSGVVLASSGLTTVSGLLNGPTVGVTTGGLLVAGGQVLGSTVTVAGGTTVSGGSLRAHALNPGAVTVQGSGDVYADNALTVTVGTPTLDGTIASGGNLTINSAGPLTLGSTPASLVALAAGGSLTVMTAGDFTQAAGTIAATAAVTISTSGNVTQTAGTIEAGSGAAGSGTVTLLGTGPASTALLQGVLSAGTIQVSEPNVALTFAPPALLGTATVAVGPLQPITLHCPGCDANVAAATYPLLATPGTGRPATLRVDGNSLVLGTIAADVIELHSVGDTTQTASGIVTAGTLLGTAGYGFTPAANALPTWNAPATAGSVVLGNAGNSVAQLGPYYAGGSVTLTTGGTLTVVDLVAAGGAQTATSMGASTIALTAPAITVDGVAHSGSLRFGLVQGGAFATNARPVGPSPAPAPSALAATDVLFNQISLQTDRLNILGAAPRVEALDGRVAIAPLTAGLAMSVDAAQTGAGSLVSSQLGLISTIGGAANVGSGGRQSLLLGSLDGTLTHAAGSLALNAPLGLTNLAATLGLYATGDITENTAAGLSIGRQAGGANPAVTGTLTGQAGGEVRLVGRLADGSFGPLTLASAPGAAPANHFDVLNGFAAGAALAIADTPDANSGQGGLVVHGTVSAGAGALGLLSVGTVQGAGRVGGTIAIGDAGVAAALNAGAQTVTLVARDGSAGQAAITLNGAGGPGSTITAGTLQGRAQTVDTSATRYDVSLLEAAATTNGVAALGDFTVGTGPANGVISAQGAFTLQAHGPSGASPLSVTGNVTSDNTSITANAITVTITGAIGACIVPVIASGNVVLTADGAGPAVTVAGGTVGAQSQVAIQAALGSTVTAGTVDAPLVTLGGGLTLSGGQVFGNTVAIAGGATVTGGQLHANRLATTAAGNTPVPIAFGGGDVYAGNDLTITAAGGTLSGVLTAGNTLGVSASGSLASSAVLTAGSVLGIATGGDFLQSAGLIASGSAVRITAGGQVGQSGGTIEAGSGAGVGTIFLAGAGVSGGGAGLGGTLSANQVQVTELGYAVQFAPAVLAGDARVAAGGLNLALHCPGCDLNAPAATASNTAVVGAYRPSVVRLDGGTLAVGSIGADTIELHSAGDTTASGALTGLTLTGSAGYSASGTDANGRPTYTLGAAAAGGHASFGGAANNLFTVSDYQARLSLVLADLPTAQVSAAGVTQQAAGLTLAGIVRAGPAGDPLDATTAAVSGGPLTIDTSGANGQIAITGTLAGSAVTVVASGAISEAGGGAIVADVLTGSATAATLGTATTGATAQQGNQIATLGQFNTRTGDLALNDSRNLVATNDSAAGALTLSAQAGTRTPSDPEGQAAGELSFSNLQAGSAVTLTAAAGLSGTGVATPATLSVSAGQGVLVSGASARTVTGSAGQDLSVAGGFDQAGPIGAPGAVALSDTRGLTVQNGVAAGGALRVTTDGALAIAGAASGQSVSLASGAATTISGVVQAAGVLTATAGPGTTLVTGTLTGGTQVGITAAAVDVEGTVSAPALQVSTGSSLTVGPSGTLAGGRITSVSGGGATLGGTVTASGAASVTANGISVGGRVRAATIGLDAGVSTLSSTGSLDAAGTIALRAAGDVVLAAGSTSNAGGSLTLSGPAAAPARSATLGGTVATPLLTVIADGIALPGGALSLGGVVQPSGVKAAALPTAGSGAPGGYFEATSSLVQSPTASIRPLAGYANATVRIDLTSGAGQIVLGNLFVPAGNLIVDVGAGSASGQITVRNLFALYTGTGPGAGGIRLSGTVAGQSGTGAAGLSAVSPAPNPRYEINSCALASVNCVVLRPQALPIGNPLKELSLGFFREQEDDGALLVPNITEQGL